MTTSLRGRALANDQLLERMSHYSVNFQIPERPLANHADDGSNAVMEFTGTILHEDEDADRISEIGKIKGTRVSIEGIHQTGFSAYDVLDEASDALMDIHEPFFDPETNDLREDLELQRIAGGDLLLVQEISVLPEHRGSRLGLLALLRTIHDFGGGCALVVIKPFPLQYSGKLNDKNHPAFKAAQRKLVRHWGQLGFRRVRDTEFFYFDLAYQLPTPEAILQGLGR